jgi:hypothetical protein
MADLLRKSHDKWLLEKLGHKMIKLRWILGKYVVGMLWMELTHAHVQ